MSNKAISLIAIGSRGKEINLLFNNGFEFLFNGEILLKSKNIVFDISCKSRPDVEYSCSTSFKYR